MRKQISPMFAIIVVVVALVVAALYFMSSYRAQDAREAALRRLAGPQTDAARRRYADRRRSRMGRGTRRARRGSAPAPAARAAEGGDPGGQSLPQPESAAEETGK